MTVLTRNVRISIALHLLAFPMEFIAGRGMWSTLHRSRQGGFDPTTSAVTALPITHHPATSIVEKRMLSSCVTASGRILHRPKKGIYQANHEAVNVTHLGDTMLLDLSCHYSGLKGYFHILTDCLLPALPTLAQAINNANFFPCNRSFALVPSYMKSIYAFFLESTCYRDVVYSDPSQATLFLVADPRSRICRVNASLAETTSAQIFKEARMKQVERGPPVITLIQRHSTRMFDRVKWMAQVLRTHLKMPVHIYNGNETFKVTLSIFANSRVVIGYHGAGLANAIFCASGTIVLEYTTFQDATSLALWRSNEVIAELHGNLTWIKYGIDIDRLENPYKLHRVKDKDHYIKDLQQVKITAATLYNSIERIKIALL